MSLAEIVDLTITKESATVSRAGFGVPIIVGENVNVSVPVGRFATFTDAASAKLSLVGGASTIEALQVDAFFAQSPTVTSIALGAQSAIKAATFVGTMTAGSIKATVNGVLITEAFATDTDTTLNNLATSIQAETEVATAAAVAQVLTVTPVATKAVGITYDITAATGLTAVTQTSATMSELHSAALDIILASNPDFYGVVGATRTLADQIDLADWTETNKKFLVVATADANVVDQTKAADVTSIAWYANSNALERTMVIYGATAVTEGNDAALLGKALPFDPGTYTLAFKVLAGITVDQLTPTQSTNARDKKANTYEPIGGKNIVREGSVGSGEFADVTIFIDWLESRIQESVFSALSKVLKVPFTNAGIDTVGNAIRQPLTTGQNRGGISPDEFDDNSVRIGGFVVTTPALKDIVPADKSARILKDVKFTAFLSGAIHKTKINGTVVV